MSDVKKYFNFSRKEAFIDEKDIQLAYIYLEDKINFDKSFRIMSLGSGLCHVEKLIALKYTNVKITCVDFIEEKIQMKEYKNLEYIKMDLREFRSLDFADEYDLIYSFSVLQYLSNIDIINLNNELLKLITDNGTIYHFDIPDKRKKYLSRMDKIINQHKTIYNIFNKNLDFKDSYSHWVSFKPFKNIENANVLITYPSFHYDRFEVKINRN